MKKILFVILLLPSMLFAQKNVGLKYRYTSSIRAFSTLITYEKNDDLDFSLQLISKDNSDRFYNTHKFYYLGFEVNKAIKTHKHPNKIEVYLPEKLLLDLVISAKAGAGSGVGFIRQLYFEKPPINNNFFLNLYNTFSVELISEHATVGFSIILGVFSFNDFKFEQADEKLSFKGLSYEVNIGIFI